MPFDIQYKTVTHILLRQQFEALLNISNAQKLRTIRVCRKEYPRESNFIKQ